MGTLFPRVIKKTPLLTSTAELRFTSGLPGAALFGTFFAAERERYPNVQQLPFASMPDEFHIANPLFKHQPHYKLTSASGGTAIQIGPRSFSIAGEADAPHINVPYINGEFARLLRVLDQVGSIINYERLGLRYVNFFEGQNVMDRLTLKVALEEMDLVTQNTQLRAEILSEPFKAALTVMSDAQVAMGTLGASTSPAQNAKSGTLIDIDVFADPVVLADGDRPQRLTEMFVSAHDVAKHLFFKTLTDDFILELEPEE